jgi:hypothetical protein
VSCAATLASRPGTHTMQSRPPASLLDGPDTAASVTHWVFIFWKFSGSRKASRVDD